MISIQRIIDYLRRNQVTIILFLFSILVLTYLSKVNILNPDGYAYIYCIYFWKRPSVILGRPGYMLIYLIVWNFLKYTTSISIFEFQHILRGINILFAASTVVIWEKISEKIWNINKFDIIRDE